LAKIYLLGIFLLVLAVLTILYLEDDGQLSTQYIQQDFKGLIQDMKIFPDGSSVNILQPDQPQSEKKAPTQEVIDKATGENATNIDKAVEKIVTPDPDIVQYSRDDSRGIVVAGYILLKDEITGKNIEPYIFRVFIQIECDEEKNSVDGFNYCNTESIFGRVTTEHGGVDSDGDDLGGWFTYTWHPTRVASSGFYDIDVLVTKDQPNLDGTYKDYHTTYKIQLL